MAKNRIKELRDSANPKITLKELSEKLKEKGLSFTDSQLSQYEQGNRSPRNNDIWVALSEIFNVSAAYILGLSDEQDKYRKDEKIISLKDEEKITFSDSKFSEDDFISRYVGLLWYIKENNFFISDEDFETIYKLIMRLNYNRADSGFENNIFDYINNSGKFEKLKLLWELEDASIEDLKKIVKKNIKDFSKDDE